MVVLVSKPPEEYTINNKKENLLEKLVQNS
jgi:hypothetical protein